MLKGLLSAVNDMYTLKAHQAQGSHAGIEQHYLDMLSASCFSVLGYMVRHVPSSAKPLHWPYAKTWCTQWDWQKLLPTNN